MEEKKLKILAVQMSSKIADKTENFSKVESIIKHHIEEDTDVIILPEVWNIGWMPSIFSENSEDLSNSPTLIFLSSLAKKYNVNIIGGSFILSRESKGKKARFNTCPFINRNGDLIATYDKMHLFSYYGCDEGKFVQAGETPKLIEINGVKIGLTICYDIRFPEIYREYRKAGADFLINMAAWPKSRAIHWESLSKARAIENQTFMLALTQSGLIENDEFNLGHSMLIDFNGDILAETTKEEGAISFELKFDEMYKFREKCTVLLDIHDKYTVK